MESLGALPKSILSTLVITQIAGGRITYSQLREASGLSESSAKRRIRDAKNGGFLICISGGAGPGNIAQFLLTKKAKDLLP